MKKRSRSGLVAVNITARVAFASVAGVLGIASACGDTDTTTPPEIDASGPALPKAEGGADTATTTDTSIADTAVVDTSIEPNDASANDASDASDASDATVTSDAADASDASDANADATADGGAACSGSTDTFYSQVLAYIPCTSTIADVTGKSTLTLYNAPTVSATPAGAPGGASCSLGNANAFNTAKGFAVAMPSSIGTGDFTVEVSVYQTAYFEATDQQSEILIGTSYPPAAGGFPAFFSHKNVLKVQFIGGSGATTNYTDTGSALNTWQSYAASRVGGTTYVFRNGTLLTSFADASNYSNTTFYVGHQSNGSYNAVIGSAGQIRITKAGRYTTSYQGCSGGFATN